MAPTPVCRPLHSFLYTLLKLWPAWYIYWPIRSNIQILLLHVLWIMQYILKYWCFRTSQILKSIALIEEHDSRRKKGRSSKMELTWQTDGLQLDVDGRRDWRCETKRWLTDNSFCCSPHIFSSFFFLSQWVRTSALIYDSNSSASSDEPSSPEPITIHHSWRQPGHFSLIMPENNGGQQRCTDAGVNRGVSHYRFYHLLWKCFFLLT